MTPPTKPTPGEAARAALERIAQALGYSSQGYRPDHECLDAEEQAAVLAELAAAFEAGRAAAVKAAREGENACEYDRKCAPGSLCRVHERPDSSEAERAHCRAAANEHGNGWLVDEVVDLLQRERTAVRAEGEIEIERWKDECKVLQQNNAVAEAELKTARTERNLMSDAHEAAELRIVELKREFAEMTAAFHLADQAAIARSGELAEMRKRYEELREATQAFLNLAKGPPGCTNWLRDTLKKHKSGGGE